MLSQASSLVALLRLLPWQPQDPEQPGEKLSPLLSPVTWVLTPAELWPGSLASGARPPLPSPEPLPGWKLEAFSLVTEPLSGVLMVSSSCGVTGRRVGVGRGHQGSLIKGLFTEVKGTGLGWECTSGPAAAGRLYPSQG